MNQKQFWQLIEAARNQASNPDDGEDVARRATSQLATHSAEEIVAAQQVLWDLRGRISTEHDRLISAGQAWSSSE
ncbi:DUF4240 domain-containing protein [Streptomyces sp. NPDC056159]|uniref:DUF4240 domain-containing protein n=1 Tax=Streptomyces sp. NPDC056159 TaxID=3155537 RepID=UPI003425ABE3